MTTLQHFFFPPFSPLEVVAGPPVPPSRGVTFRNEWVTRVFHTTLLFSFFLFSSLSFLPSPITSRCHVSMLVHGCTTWLNPHRALAPSGFTLYRWFRASQDSPSCETPLVAWFTRAMGYRTPRAVDVSHTPVSLSHRTKFEWAKSNTRQRLGQAARTLVN